MVDVASDSFVEAQMLRHMGDYTLPRALYAAAELGLVDEIRAGVTTVAALAAATACREDGLGRLVRLLVAAGVLREEAGHLSVTSLGEPLASDAPSSVRYELMRNDEYQAWGELLHTLRTGLPAYDRVFGTSLYARQAADPERADAFARHMRQRTSAMFRGLFDELPWEEDGLVVDVGGGDGSVLTAILHERPTLHGVVFDLPFLASAACEQIAAHQLAARCRFTAGDASESVPPGGTTYLLVNVLHNWDDAVAAAILRACAAQVKEAGRVVICEYVVPGGPAMHPSKSADLAMLVLLGGRERTLEAWSELVGDAGLRIERVVTTAGATGSALVCVRGADD